MRRGTPLSRGQRRMILRLVVDTRVLLAVTAPPAFLSFRWSIFRDRPPCLKSDVDLGPSSGDDLHEFRDRPHKPRQLAGDRGRDDGRRLSGSGEVTITPRSRPAPSMRSRGSARQALLPQQLLSVGARREPITPGSLGRRAARHAIPGFRDAGLPARRAAGVLGRSRANRPSADGIVEAVMSQVSDQCRRRDQSQSAQRLPGAHHRGQRPIRSAASISASRRSRRAVAASTAAMQSSSTM